MKNYLISIMLVGACGGSDLDPGSGDDPGGGTSTLVVDGNVTAEPRLVNARTAGDYDTDFSVRITLNGQTVTTGNVVVTSATGSVPLVFNADQEARWTGRAPGYDEVYVLDVDSGPDFIDGVRVDGPDIHIFTEPTVGATVDSTVPLLVAWACDHGADSASIKAEELDSISIPDTGEYMLAPGALKAEQDKARENTLRITRTNRVTPAGAAGGSEWSVTIRNEIQVVAQPNPAL